MTKVDYHKNHNFNFNKGNESFNKTTICYHIYTFIKVIFTLFFSPFLYRRQRLSNKIGTIQLFCSIHFYTFLIYTVLFIKTQPIIFIITLMKTISFKSSLLFF